jgi:hypothetical protein
LLALDEKNKAHGKKLGLIVKDQFDEEGNDEEGEGEMKELDMEEDFESLDMLIKQRHLGTLREDDDFESESEDEEDVNAAGGQGGADNMGDNEEDEEREERRNGKQFETRVKMKQVLAKSGGNISVDKLFGLEEDDGNSQSMMLMLKVKLMPICSHMLLLPIFNGFNPFTYIFLSLLTRTHSAQIVPLL